MDKIIYRKAKEEELDKIMDLQMQIFNREQKIPLKDIADFLNKSPQCWCAVYRHHIIGAVAAWKEIDGMHWGRFVVDPKYRGKHIGRTLAKLSFDDLFSQDIDIIYMEAREITAKIVCKMGGEIIGNSQEFYVGTVTPIVLRKSTYSKV